MSEEYCEEISFMIEKTNQILLSRGIRNISENEDFLKKDFSPPNYITYILTREECVELRFAFLKSGIEIGINEFYEIYDFSYQEIVDDSSQYENCLITLCFNQIICKKCYFGYNSFYLRTPTGQVLQICKIYTSLITPILLPLSRILKLCTCTEYHALY